MMYIVGKYTSLISFTFSSVLSYIETVISETEEYARGFGQGDTSNLLIVLRELLKNAVVHGNRLREDKTVTCKVHLLDEGVARIEIEDNGEGFDFRGLDLKIPEKLGGFHKRGFMLVNALSQRIEFYDGGRRVHVWVKIDDGVAPLRGDEKSASREMCT